jgi:hypothetical protein
MKVNQKIVWMVIAGVVVAAALFLLADFRLIRSKTNSEYTSSSIAFNNPEGNAQLPQHQSLDIYILGQDRISRQLARVLPRILEINPYVGEINILDGPPVDALDSVLVIEPIENDLFWTPVYGSSDMDVQYYYASDGKVGWMGDEVLESEPGEYTKRISGTLSESDRSFGVLSLPGYSRFLAESMGLNINTSLENVLKQ